MALSDDELASNNSYEDDGLFGDEDNTSVRRTRELSDSGLDSGDDEGRFDRANRENVEDTGYESGTDARILEATLWRHPVPKPSDGQLNTLRIPKFLSIEPRVYESSNFSPPTLDHHSDTKSANFSPISVALSTIRYRINARTNRSESNTIIHKWNDGSMTLAIGNQHYELQVKPLAPPMDSKPYQEIQDSHTYLASPSIASQLLLLLGHISNQFTVLPNKDVEDDALEKLQKSLAAASRCGGKGEEKSGPELITNTEDPELQKKKAEIAEKERIKAQRRRENAVEKQGLPRYHVGGRGGLNIDDIEGRSGRKDYGTERKAQRARKNRSSHDSDDQPRVRRTREDEYDKEDDFLADSDEEFGDSVEDDESDEEGDVGEPKLKKQKTSKPLTEYDDADAEADLEDEDAPAPAPVIADTTIRSRKRNIIDDEDD